MSTSEKQVVAVFGCLGVLAAIPLMMVLNGYVFLVLWGWFAVPVFHLPQLNIPQAIGISILVGRLTSHTAEKQEDDKWYSPFARAFSYPLAALGMGWIVKGFL